MAGNQSLFRKSLRYYLASAGLLITVFCLWQILGLPILIDRLCILSETPIEAEYIVCLGNGLIDGNLPTTGGWERIYTSVQLYLDGYGRKIVFTGGGAGLISEAEVYAEAAQWLGMDEGDAVLEAEADGTSEHPSAIQKIQGTIIKKTTPLNIVTSPLHSKRAALCFKKAGFTAFSLVTGYRATGERIKVVYEPSEIPGAPPVRKEILLSREGAKQFLRELKKSGLPGFHPSDKAYGDMIIRLKKGSEYFFSTVRELAALGAYKIKGYI